MTDIRSYSLHEALPDFEDDNAALAALLLEISRKAPIHQIFFSKKDVEFDKSTLIKKGKLLSSTKTFRESSRYKEAELWLYQNVYIYLRVYAGLSNVNFIFISNKDDNGEEVRHVFEEFRGLSQPISSPLQDAVKIKFWSMASYGPKYSSKFLELPSWEDIKKNYAIESIDSISRLMNMQPSQIGDGGKIILLHGDAGVGKTTLIRALIREWQEWCDVEYIIDPESILSSSSYLSQVILEEEDEDHDENSFNEYLTNLFYSTDSDDLDHYSANENSTGVPSKFRLLIFEDTEELISSDDKGSVSPSVSRLLNIGDGLLGQGLKILILITTNVKLEKLHPALVRPGRTLANIHIPKLSTNEATTWMGSQHKEATLAELYEEKNKEQIIVKQEDWEAPGTYL